MSSPPRSTTSTAERSPGRPDRTFWEGRRVLLTGHTGFKGSWLSLWLSSLGADVTGCALDPPTEPSLFEQARVADSIRSIITDIRDPAGLEAAFAVAQPEVVIHMAAQSVVKRGYADPVETYSVNVLGTVQLLETVRRQGNPCVVVNVTSDKCYAHSATGRAYREDDPMGGDDPYSNSKGCAELVTLSYRQSFFPPAEIGRHRVALASARAGNAIGGGDWTPDQLIPDLMRAFAAGRPCGIRNPGGVRPWQFVLEPLRGYLLLAERLWQDGAGFASGWNFGPAGEDAKPVSWIADHLVRAWGPPAAWTKDQTSHPAEAAVLRLNTAKAEQQLHWRPAIGLTQALDWVVEWYRDSGHGVADARRIAMAQIARYEQLLS